MKTDNEILEVLKRIEKATTEYNERLKELHRQREIAIPVVTSNRDKLSQAMAEIAKDTMERWAIRSNAV